MIPFVTFDPAGSLKRIARPLVWDGCAMIVIMIAFGHPPATRYGQSIRADRFWSSKSANTMASMASTTGTARGTTDGS
jgi:hypothetical protein